MRYELKSLPIWPLTKVAFFVHLVVGFLVGLFYAAMLVPFFGLMMNIPDFNPDEFGIAAAPIGALMMLMPFLFALSGAFFGTLFTIIVAAVYNLMARLVGGVELNLAAVQSDQVPAATKPAAPVQAPARPDTATPPAEKLPPTPPPPPPVGGKEPPPTGEADDKNHLT